jgi:hypothetical protein
MKYKIDSITFSFCYPKNIDTSSWRKGKYKNKYYRKNKILYISTVKENLLIRLKPRIVIGADATNHDTYHKLIDYLNNQLLFNLKFKDLKLSRLDYTLDFNIPKDQRALYINLFKKLPEYNRLKRTDSKFKTTVYLRNKTKQFMIYDKTYHKSEYKDILRCELALFRRYIKKSSEDLIYYFDSDIQKISMYAEIKNIVRPGDYYKLKEIKKIIDKSGLRKNVKSNIIDFIKCYNKAKSLKQVREQYRQYDKYLEALKQLNINPILIHHDSNISKMDNLFKNLFVEAIS